MKKLLMLASILCLTVCLAAPASALEFTMEAPTAPEYAKATSVEPIFTADGGEQANPDLSKNAALIPPTFGSPTSYLPGSGEPLTPNLTGAGLTASSGFIGGNSLTIYPGTSVSLPDIGEVEIVDNSSAVYGYTPVSSGLYYNGGYLGNLKIPTLGVDVKIYEGTDSATLAKGAGHFTDTSIWQGNVAIAGHNRGTNCYFGEIHTLCMGDTITLTTKMGVRNYSVVSVSKVSEKDNSMLASTVCNQITLITCVRDQSAYRWCVQAVEIK